LKRNHIFISHSIHDKRDKSLARKLATALTAFGIKVWIAPNSIPAGEQWKSKIDTGIMEECSHFFVILSASSITSTWVLNEIELARQRYDLDQNFIILPLVVSDLKDYPGNTFLDQFQHIPFSDDFHSTLEYLLEILGALPSVPEQLLTYILTKTKDFVGRNYIFDSIQDFFKRNECGYFIIQGDPGEGKTTILSKYIQDNDSIAHFNIRGLGTITYSEFIRNILKQIYAKYGARLNINKESHDDSGFLLQLLDRTSQLLHKDESLVIVLDALDEAEWSNSSNLFHLPPVLPKGVYFLLTQRRIAKQGLPLQINCPFVYCDLKDYHNQSIEDIRLYVKNASHKPDIKQWIEIRNLEYAEFIDTLVIKSEHNFMYLYYIISAIEQGDYKDVSLEKLPVGLGEYYEDHWKRMGMMASSTPRDKIYIIYVLAEVRRPVSRSLIVDFLEKVDPSLDVIRVQEVLDEWRQFFSRINFEPEPRYSLYHNSFSDFLHQKEIVRAAGIKIESINRMITDNLWDEFVTGWLDKNEP